MIHFVRAGLGHIGAAAAALVVAAVIASPASAQSDFPAKPIKVIVGFPAGSVADVTVRLLGQKASPSLGQQVIVEDRPGASSNIAAELVARAPKDGYTLLMATVANVINASLYRHLSFNFGNDFTPVFLIGSAPTLLVVNPSLPVHNVQELIAYAKPRPGQVFYASSGNGTASHLAGEMFNLMAGVKLAHIPYKGSSDILNDLIAGRVMVAFTAGSTLLPHIKSGTVRGLASAGLKRTAAAPDLPTISESGLPGFDAAIWLGVLAPSGTPAPIVERLAGALGAAMHDPDVKAQFAAQGIDEIGKGPRDFAAYIRDQTDKWAKAVEISGAKVD